jgi:hopanoid biosynthesis associated radical SAM protein HpnH
MEVAIPLPLLINLRIARHLALARMRGRGPRIPLVLMLEITHSCNLRCEGCGRIREYAESRSQRLSRQQAKAAMIDADTPVVTISGGEPLLHPDAPAIAADALDLGKVVYFCTNGLLLADRLKEFSPHPAFYFNVHLDGLPEKHDRITGLPGSGERALGAIAAARRAGFGVTTNTTLYQETRPEDLVELFARLIDLDIDGMMLAAGFAYEVGTPAETLSRLEAQQRFRRLHELWGEKKMYHTPIYLEFLRGERELACTPWGTVTYNSQGWKQPCYLLTDGHVASFKELMENTDWDSLGPGRDPRCAEDMLHSGFEPSVMDSLSGPRDWWRIIRWQFGH